MNDKIGFNLLDYLATGINKNNPVIQAIFSDYEGKGAIANEIEDIAAFIDFYTKTDDIRNHTDDSLEMISKQFTKIKRQLMETDDRLLRRTLALTERKGDLVWGNALNMKHALETYFEHIHAYISENTDDSARNLLKDSDFAEDAWTLSGGAAYSFEARFSGRRGLHLDKRPASCSQTVPDLNAGLYTLHFFLNGRCGVFIRNTQGQYWNGTEEAGNYVLTWKDDEFVNEFETREWSDVCCFIKLDDEMTELSIEFMLIEGESACVDFVRLFKKPEYPSYTITVQYEGYTLSPKNLHLGKGAADPADGIDYAKESYFDHAYIIGRKGAYRDEVYQSVLDIVRPRGVQAFVEFVEKGEEGEDSNSA